MGLTKRLTAVCAWLALTPSGVRAEIIEANAHYPEGPLWHQGRLYYAEMSRDRIVVRRNGKAVTFWRRKGCGPTSIAPTPGGFVVSCHIGRLIARLGAGGKTISTIVRDTYGRPIDNPNDSIADGRGGVYFTSSGAFSASAPVTGRVYYLPPSGVPREVAGNIHYANGVVVSPDQRYLYVSAHISRRVYRFEIGANGRLGPRRVFVRLAPRAASADRLAGPDGLAFDRHGNLYIAEYGAGRIHVVGPDRRWRKIITLGNRYVTNLEFATSGRYLYVTAPASNRLWPYRGVVLRIDNPLRDSPRK
ncbi:MAG: SMP-30/gluconolactonase/LRE family protein [Alphaproteobacteria bacterium]